MSRQYPQRQRPSSSHSAASSRSTLLANAQPFAHGVQATQQSRAYPSRPAHPAIPTYHSTMHSPSLASFRDKSAPPTPRVPSINEKYGLTADPALYQQYAGDLEDPDDDLHNPRVRGHRSTCSARGIANMFCLFIIVAGIVTLFAGYPILTYFIDTPITDREAFNVGVNATGQTAKLFANMGLVDRDTPIAARTIKSLETGEDMQLVFSDEFNTPGRTFYPGDDPYWEAVDLHYFQTGDAEWYDPQQIMTADGALRIWFNQTKNHDLNFMGGMLTSWNKFCFTGGMIIARVSLPGSPHLAGLWPAVWTMGNLGRAGYGASLEGMWPYTYDSCDVGTLPNQTTPGSPIPTNDDPFHGGRFSFLPGQRLSRCTCANDKTHPGPKHDDGTWVGRSAPEIDLFEAVVNAQNIGGISQSAQWAPFDDQYIWQNTTENILIQDPTVTHLNGFRGGVFQQSTSALSTTDQTAYTQSPGQGAFSVYGYEYKPGFDGSYITWISGGVVSWSMRGAGMAANPASGIQQRPVSQEPMYIIMNLGMSSTFSRIDPGLLLPAHMDIDYIRVYQPANAINVGCSPPDFPTAEYIERFSEAYTNENLTVFSDMGGVFPGNKLLDQC